MAIVDYAGLVEGVQKWVARSDTTFTNRIPDFVALAEDRIYNGHDSQGRGPLYTEPLRAAILEHAATLTFVAGQATLPADYLGAKKLHRATDMLGLTYMPPQPFAIRQAYVTPGDPLYYTIEAGTVTVTPSYDGDMALTYWRKLPALTSEAPSNTLLLLHPMIYLTATLAEAFAFIQEADLSLAHVTRLRGMIDGLNKTASDVRTSGGAMRVMPRNPIP